MGDMAGEEEEVVCQHCDSPCWLSEEPCAEEERRRRVGADPTTAGERDSLEAFFLRLLLLDNIKQEAQEEASQQEVLPAASDTPELRQFRPRQPRPATPAEEEPQDEACCRCQAIVYRAELRQCRGRSYHAACFSCLSCRRRLDAMSATEGPDGEAYCPACYRRFLADSSRPVGAGSTTSILARPGERDGCPRCGGKVFQAERLLSGHGVYHRSCFRCAEVECGRSLDAASYCDSPEGLVFCKSCYSRLHGPQGFGYSNTLMSDPFAAEPSSRPTTPGPRATSSLSSSSAPRCPRCCQAVFAQERVFVGERQWHRTCLTCGTCSSHLDPASLHEVGAGAGVLCKRCYGRGHRNGELGAPAHLARGEVLG